MLWTLQKTNRGLYRTRLEVKLRSGTPNEFDKRAAHLLSTLVLASLKTWEQLLNAGHGESLRSNLDGGLSAKRENDAGESGGGEILAP